MNCLNVAPVDSGAPIKALLASTAELAVMRVIGVCRDIGKGHAGEPENWIVQALYVLLKALKHQNWEDASGTCCDIRAIADNNDLFDASEITWIADLIGVIQGAHRTI
ncbi:MAG: hypothetical protein DRP42_07985 [Tenericutes bacterium]|nr:MAG: hypothetical protein DRP42_07985 [Mycoplasmatota bacterium]